MVTTRRGTNTSGRPTTGRRRRRRAVPPAAAPAAAVVNKYKDTDVTHRHRVDDDKEKTIIVPAHRRRKP